MATVRYDDITYQTYGDLPVVGSHAPDINLVNTKLANVSLSNWMGMRKIMNIFVSIEGGSVPSRAGPSIEWAKARKTWRC